MKYYTNWQNELNCHIAISDRLKSKMWSLKLLSLLLFAAHDVYGKNVIFLLQF